MSEGAAEDDSNMVFIKCLKVLSIGRDQQICFWNYGSRWRTHISYGGYCWLLRSEHLFGWSFTNFFKSLVST